MSKVLVTESYLTDIGDAIRAKNKSSTKYKPSEMAKAITSIPVGDSAIVVNSDAAWKYTITQKEHENIAVGVSHVVVGDNTSGYQTKLIFSPTISSSYGYNAGTVRRTVDEENHIANFTADDVTEVAGLLNDGWAGIYALGSSSNNAINYYFNDYNNHRSSVVSSSSNIENLLILGYYKEDSSGNLVAKTQKNVAEYKPSSQVSLKKYQNKYATSIDNNAFYGCKALTSVDIPNATSVGMAAFDGCTALTSVDLPNATSIDNNAFYNCTSLRTIDLPNVTSIGAIVFYGCTMDKIYLRSKTMCTCQGALSFANTTYLSIYVPNSLIDSYKTANHWGAYASYFKSLESIELSKISIIGSNINTYNGNTTGTYKVQYNDGDVLPEQAGVTWSITGNATISQDGIVTLKNASVGDKLTITATSTYNTSISASLTVSVINVAVSMTVDLNNGQWVDSGTTIDGHTVYKSDAGSYHVDNGKSTCTVTVKGYSLVTVYLRSYAESSWDYAEVGPLDGTVDRHGSSSVLSTSGKQSSTTYLSHTFAISDAGTHTFQVLYSKDTSGNSNDDRGYFYVVVE